MAKRILTGLRLDKIAAVDRPCQEHAKMTIMKRAPDPAVEEIVKFCSDEQGAQTFTTILTEEESRRRNWKAQEALYPVMDALSSSVRSIVADQSLSDDTRQAMLRQSVEDFMNTIREKAPEVETELSKLLNNPEDYQMGDKPTVEELQKQLDTMKGELEKATAQLNEAIAKASMTDDEKEHLGKLNDDDKKKFSALTPEERAKQVKVKKSDDEVFKTSAGVEIRKSQVGDGVFAVMKSQEEEIAKNKKAVTEEIEKRELVELTKRAGDELGKLPGTDVEKANLLREIAKMPEDVRKTAEQILKAGNDAFAKAFDTFGTEIGKSAGAGSAQGKLDEMVKKHAAEHKVTTEQAYSDVIKSGEGNRLYQETVIEKRERDAA